MALLIEGRFTGKAVRGEVGRRGPNSPVTVNIDVEVGEGEHKGKRFQYVGKCGPDNIKYTKWAAKAVGWKGKDIVQTLDRDIKAANLTIEFDLKIARFERDDGSVQEWTAVDRIHGIREAIPVAADEASKVNSWFDEPDSGQATSSGRGDYGGYSAPPSNGGHPNAPGNDDDLPFASADIGHEPSPIAAILRRSV